MKRVIVAVLCILGIVLVLWFVSRPSQVHDRVTSVADDDAEMAAAIATARKSIPELLEAIKTGVDSYSVKVPITDPNGTEHFWLSEVTYSNGFFSGKNDNDPNTVKSVTFGQQYTANQNAISDWLYVRNHKVTGNYTLRVLLPRMSPSDAAKARKTMGWD